MESVKKKKTKASGVTLIEVLVAMLLLTVGMYVTYSSFPFGFAASYRSRNRTIASELAQMKMEEILLNRVNGTVTLNGVTHKCYHAQKGVPCRTYTTNVEDDSINYDDDTYNCSSYYGGINTDGSLQNATYCSWHSGTQDAGNWKSFPAGNDPSLSKWWYHIDITPVVDPLRKYRSTGGLTRITVTVRGPVDAMGDWDIVAQPVSSQIRDNDPYQDTAGRKLKYKPAEVVLSTMKANNYIASARIIRKNDGEGGFTWVDGLRSDGKAVYVDNIRNFTVINQESLASAEKMDRPKVSLYCQNKTKRVGNHYRTLSLVEQAGNFYNLDNCMITREAEYAFFDGSKPHSIGPAVNPTTPDLIGRWGDSGANYAQTILFQANMTNRIIFIKADDIDSPESTAKIPGILYFAYPLYNDDETFGSTNTVYPSAGFDFRPYFAKKSEDPNNLGLGDPNLQDPYKPLDTYNTGYSSKYSRGSQGSIIPSRGDPRFTSSYTNGGTTPETRSSYLNQTYIGPKFRSSGTTYYVDPTVLDWRDYFEYDDTSTPPAYKTAIVDYSADGTNTFDQYPNNLSGWWQYKMLKDFNFYLRMDQFVNANLCTKDYQPILRKDGLDSDSDGNVDREAYYIQQLINVRAP